VKTFVGELGDSCHAVSLDEIKPFLIQTLRLTIQRIAFPDWFQHNDPGSEDDEQHIKFLEFRRSLTKIFKRIFLVDEQIGFDFVQASIAQLTQGLSCVRPMEVDAVLYLYKEAGETVKDVPAHMKAKGPLAVCFVQLVACEALVKSNDWMVQLALIELYVRYGKIFSVHKELFPTYGQRILEAFIGAQGIRASDQRVVTRACFMLQRFVKTAKQEIMPYTVRVLEAVGDLLGVPFLPSSLVPVQVNGATPTVVVKGMLRADDQAFLYEAIATLVSSMPEEQMRPTLQLLLKASATNLSDILNASPARISSDPKGYASWAARSLDVIATVSKAFTIQHTCVAAEWQETLPILAKILERFGQVSPNMGLGRAALFHCRRMVEVLGEQFLVPLDALLPLMCASNDPTELKELNVFAHHMVTQFHGKAQPLLQKWLSTLFMRPYTVWGQMPEDSDQLKREKLELGSSLLQLLKEIAQRCPAALLEVMVRDGHGQEMKNFLVAGLRDPSELRSLLLATTGWSALLEFIVSLPQAQDALASLPLAHIFFQMLWSVVRMDYSDAMSQKILNEASSILRSLTSKRFLSQALHQQAMEGLRQALVEALPGLRDNSAPQRLCELLVQDSSLKDIRSALQQCAVDWRKGCTS